MITPENVDILELQAFTGVVLALTKQKGSDLVITACVFAGALVYFLFVQPRGNPYWKVSGVIPDSTSGAAVAVEEESA